MCKAINVAHFFLRCPDTLDITDGISNMKLQKLLYFAQGHALAELDRPLFQDDFEAWRHGPVIPVLYDIYKDYGSGVIKPPVTNSPRHFSDDEFKLLSEIWQEYGCFSAWALRDMSHNTPPWKNHWHEGGKDVIPKDEIKKYFKTLYNE